MYRTFPSLSVPSCDMLLPCLAPPFCFMPHPAVTCLFHAIPCLAVHTVPCLPCLAVTYRTVLYLAMLDSPWCFMPQPAMRCLFHASSCHIPFHASQACSDVPCLGRSLVLFYFKTILAPWLVQKLTVSRTWPFPCQPWVAVKEGHLSQNGRTLAECEPW
jgi:hypothetical protein